MDAAWSAGDSNEQAIIDVLIAIDALTMVESYPPGTAASPTSIDQPLIFLVVRKADGTFGNGTKELKLAAEVLDVVRWRETTLSLNGNFTALLYGFTALKGAGLFTPPAPRLVQMHTPLPNASDPLHPTTQAINNFFWETTIVAKGEVTYTFQFMVLDRNGAVQGYYYWDPFISITN